jgi:hypothetical protein
VFVDGRIQDFSGNRHKLRQILQRSLLAKCPSGDTFATAYAKDMHWNKTMQVNAFITDIGRQGRQTDEDRLPVRTAALAVLVLSVLGWATIILPVVVFLHR